MKTDLGLANWKSFPLLEKMMSPTSASHRTERSCAFFIKPPRRFENVTCLVVAFSILLILIFRRTISLSGFWILPLLPLLLLWPFFCVTSLASPPFGHVIYSITTLLNRMLQQNQKNKTTAIDTIKLIHNNFDDVIDMAEISLPILRSKRKDRKRKI